MGKAGNFLQYAASKLGVDVGFGKMILIYKDKIDVKKSELTATSINSDIASGEIIGIIKGWHTVAGASVAEINVERTGSAEMKLIRPEILADVLTFENNLVNNEVINDLVKLGTVDAILLDDHGSAFGDYSPTHGKISTMKLNFSGKTTSSMQRDNTTEKTVAVTVRYLVDDLSFVAAETETELIESKELLSIQYYSKGIADLVFSVKSKLTGEAFASAFTDADIVASGAGLVMDAAAYDPATGLLSIISSAPITSSVFTIEISGDDFYSKQYQFNIPA